MIKLIDGVRQNKKHPETFSIPSRKDKLNIGAGTYVKLGFINPDKGRQDPDTVDERMWVLVQTMVGPRRYQGILHNEPKSWEDLFFPEVHNLPGS